MVFFLYTHFIEYFIVLLNPKFVKIMHHTEVFSNISTFQLAGKIEGHKPADDITGVGNDLPIFHIRALTSIYPTNSLTQ
jgi:hypothetical protein